MDKTVRQIAELVGGTVVGDGAIRITGANGIREAGDGELSFVSDSRYLPHLSMSRAAAVLVPREFSDSGKTLIQVDDPYEAFGKILLNEQAYGLPRPPGCHPSAVIGAGVQLGADVALGPRVVIGDHAVIGARATVHAGSFVGPGSVVGEDTVTYPNVTVREMVKVGARCVLHSGAVIGSDGFGFSRGVDGYSKIPQIGTVVLEDDVEVGANSAIDRATFGQTVIGQGTKIDNLVQIGHNVRIGKHCVISGTTGIAGSAIIGDNVRIGAQSGVAGHLEIGDGAVIAARSGVTKSVGAGQVVSGYFATDHDQDKRVIASQRWLPSGRKRLRELEKKVQQLEELLHGQAEDNS